MYWESIVFKIILISRTASISSFGSFQQACLLVILVNVVVDAAVRCDVLLCKLCTDHHIRSRSGVSYAIPPLICHQSHDYSKLRSTLAESRLSSASPPQSPLSICQSLNLPIHRSINNYHPIHSIINSIQWYVFKRYSVVRIHFKNCVLTMSLNLSRLSNITPISKQETSIYG